MTIAYAHTGSAGPQADVWAYLDDWSFDPVFVIPLLLALLYFKGLSRVRRDPDARFGRWRPWAFASGFLVVALALLTPIGALAEVSFVFHFIQHDLIALYGVPLVLLGAPFIPVVRGIPWALRRALFIPFARWRLTQRAVRLLTHPMVAFAIFEGWILMYHVPSIFYRSLFNDGFHYFAHLMLIGGAVLFWWNVITPYPFPQRLHPLLACVMLFGSAIANTGLCAMITFADEPLYGYNRPEVLMGLTRLEDQTLGAAAMWVMGGMFRLIVIMVVAFRYAAEEERKEPYRQQQTLQSMADAAALHGH